MSRPGMNGPDTNDSDTNDPGTHEGEVLAALEAVAAATGVPDGHGEKVRLDRRSDRRHLGVRTPDRRRRVAAGFSFTAGSPDDVLAAWHEVWMTTDCAEVGFAALDYYRTHLDDVRRPAFWTSASRWIDRVDNWAHADDLGRVYSHALEADVEAVHPVLLGWSRRDEVWHRRVAVVSLVHYSGANAVFLPIDAMLGLIANCVDDTRPDVAKAVGWVLREASVVHPAEVSAFCERHAAVLGGATMRRATDKLEPDERDRLRALASQR